METDVQSIFNEIAECGNISNQHTHLLFSSFKENTRKFKEQLEGCYLKIVKYYVQMNKKQRKIFEDVTERFFMHLWKDYEKSKNEQVINIVRHFLGLFNEGIESNQFLIRVCFSRHLFMLLRAIPIQLLNYVCDDKLGYDLINGVIGLFRSGKGQQSKTERGLAIKLSAYLQYLKSENRNNKFQYCYQVLQSEMLRTVQEEETSRLRLDALTNLELRDETFNCIVMRIRDKDVAIRLQVVKKLMKSKILFEELQLGDCYQLLHDGLRNSSADVRQQFQTLLMVQFCMIREQEENLMKENTGMQVEQEEIKKRTSNARKKISLNSNEHQHEITLMLRTWNRFLSMFQIKNTLIYPHLYDVITDIIRTIVKQYKQTNELSAYLKDIFVERMQKLQTLSPDELLLVRIIITMPRSDIDETLYDAIDSYFLDGCNLADFIQSQNFQDLQSICEIIRIAGAQINTDQQGRQELIKTLKLIIQQPQSIISVRPSATEKYNDVYEQLNESQIESLWYGQHHFQTPIIYDYLSLIPLAVRTISKLFGNDQQAFALFMYELIVIEIRNPRLNAKSNDNLYAQKRAIELKIKIQDEQIDAQEVQMRDLRNIQKKNMQQQQYALLEVEHKESLHYRVSLTQKQNDLTQEITQIDKHSLILIDGLFSCIDVQLINEPYAQKIMELVLTLNKFYHEEGDHRLPKLLALKCLAYVPLFNYDQGQIYIGVFQKILSESLSVAPSEQIQGDDPIQIIALRCLLDHILLYPIDASKLYDSDQMSAINIIIALAIKSKRVLQCTALEGLSKLILHQRLENPQQSIAVLLFIWFDKSTQSSYMQQSIITTFFRYLITISLELLQTFEQGLEIYLCICCFLTAKTKKRLNNNFLLTNHWHEQTIINNSNVGLNMLKFDKINQNQSFMQLKECMQKSQQIEDDYFLGPQEKLLFFLCKMIGDYNNLVFRPLLSLSYFDFLDFYDQEGESSQKIQVESVIFEILHKHLKQMLSTLEEKSRIQENEQALFEKINLALGDREISENCIRICDKIELNFEQQKQNVNQLVKFFQEQNIIIEDNTQSRDKDQFDLIQQAQSNDADEDISEIDSQKQSKDPKKDKPSYSNTNDVKDIDDDNSSNNQINSLGRKKAIHKRKGKQRK